MVTVIMRMYDTDSTAHGTRKERFWGFADPPLVERSRGQSKVETLPTIHLSVLPLIASLPSHLSRCML